MPVQRDVGLVRRQADESAGGEVGAGLRLREHGPAKADTDGGVEVGGGRDLVDDRRSVRHTVPAEQFVLQVVLVVEDDNRHRGPVGRPTAPPSVRDRRRGRRKVAERAERVDAATLHRGRVAGHRREHVALAQQFLGVGLVLYAEPDRGAIPPRHFGEDVAEPAAERVRVDRHRQVNRGRRRDSLAGLGVQEPGLPAQADQPFAVRSGPTRGCPG